MIIKTYLKFNSLILINIINYINQVNIYKMKNKKISLFIYKKSKLIISFLALNNKIKPVISIRLTFSPHLKIYIIITH